MYLKTAEFLTTCVLNSINSLDIPHKKINALVTDEGSAYKLARQTITGELGFEAVLE